MSLHSTCRFRQSVTFIGFAGAVMSEPCGTRWLNSGMSRPSALTRKQGEAMPPAPGTGGAGATAAFSSP